MAPSSLTSSALSGTTTTTSSPDTRAFLATLLSMLLFVLWAALAVGAVLTVVFPERTVSIAGTTASAR